MAKHKDTTPERTSMAEWEDTKSRVQEDMESQDRREVENRGIMKVTYETLAVLLKMPIGSIKFAEPMNSERTLSLHHDSSEHGASSCAEGCQPMVTACIFCKGDNDGA